MEHRIEYRIEYRIEHRIKHRIKYRIGYRIRIRNPQGIARYLLIAKPLINPLEPTLLVPVNVGSGSGIACCRYNPIA